MSQNKSVHRLFYTDESAENYIFMWLIWIQPSYGWLFIDEQEATMNIRCCLDARYAAKNITTNMQELQQKLQTSKTVSVEKVVVAWWMQDLLQPYKGEALIVEKSLPYGVYEFLQSSWPEIVFDTEHWQQTKRLIKTQQEISFIQKAISLTHMIRETIEESIDSWAIIGMTEQWLRWAMIAKAMSLWASDEAFPMIVASGSNSAIPHHKTSERCIAPWPLLVDMWWIVDGYCSDMTRTYRVWDIDTVSQEWVTYEQFEDSLEAVQHAHALGCEKAVAWAVIGDVCTSVRKSLWSQEQYFTHSLWHWLGVQVHEQPWVHYKSDGLFRSWMVVTVEPGLYYDWQYGIRREDTIIVA